MSNGRKENWIPQVVKISLKEVFQAFFNPFLKPGAVHSPSLLLARSLIAFCPFFSIPFLPTNNTRNFLTTVGEGEKSFSAPLYESRCLNKSTNYPNQFKIAQQRYSPPKLNRTQLDPTKLYYLMNICEHEQHFLLA